MKFFKRLFRWFHLVFFLPLFLSTPAFSVIKATDLKINPGNFATSSGSSIFTKNTQSDVTNTSTGSLRCAIGVTGKGVPINCTGYTDNTCVSNSCTNNIYTKRLTPTNALPDISAFNSHLCADPNLYHPKIQNIGSNPWTTTCPAPFTIDVNLATSGHANKYIRAMSYRYAGEWIKNYTPKCWAGISNSECPGGSAVNEQKILLVNLPQLTLTEAQKKEWCCSKAIGGPGNPRFESFTEDPSGESSRRYEQSISILGNFNVELHTELSCGGGDFCTYCSGTTQYNTWKAAEPCMCEPASTICGSGQCQRCSGTPTYECKNFSSDARCTGVCTECRNGSCVTSSNGTSCGDCNVCNNGTCVYRGDGTSCNEGCGICTGGACIGSCQTPTPPPDPCQNISCAACMACNSATGVCESQCGIGEICCGGSCRSCPVGQSMDTSTCTCNSSPPPPPPDLCQNVSCGACAACNPATGVCESQCGTGETCCNGSCVSACPVGQSMDTSTCSCVGVRCTSSSTSSSQCRSGKVCCNYRCVERKTNASCYPQIVQNNGCSCMICSVHSQCGSGKYCCNGSCQTTPCSTCGSCQEDDNGVCRSCSALGKTCCSNGQCVSCPTGWTLNTNICVCEPDNPCENITCPTCQECSDGICEPQSSGSCGICGTGTCSNGTCNDPGGPACGRCEEKVDPTDTCSSCTPKTNGTSCRTGKCCNGSCIQKPTCRTGYTNNSTWSNGSCSWTKICTPNCRQMCTRWSGWTPDLRHRCDSNITQTSTRTCNLPQSSCPVRKTRSNQTGTLRCNNCQTCNGGRCDPKPNGTSCGNDCYTCQGGTCTAPNTSCSGGQTWNSSNCRCEGGNNSLCQYDSTCPTTRPYRCGNLLRCQECDISKPLGYNGCDGTQRCCSFGFSFRCASVCP